MNDAELDRVRKGSGCHETGGRNRIAVWQGGPEMGLAQRSDICAASRMVMAWDPGTYMSLAIVLSLLAALPTELAIARNHRQQRDRHPSRWRETRYQTLVELGVALPAFLLFVWAIANGTPANTMVGLLLAVGGGVLTFFGLFSRRRRYYLGIGISCILGGLVMPWCSDQQVGLVFALMFGGGSTLSTAIAAWQLRDGENVLVTN